MHEEELIERWAPAFSSTPQTSDHEGSEDPLGRRETEEVREEQEMHPRVRLLLLQAEMVIRVETHDPAVALRRLLTRPLPDTPREAEV